MLKHALLLLSTTLLFAARAGECVGRNRSSCGPPPVMLEDTGSLQSTLLATRQRYSTWLREQPAARDAVELGVWQATPVLPAAEADAHVRPADGVDLDAQLAGGQPLWSDQKQWTDGKVVAFPPGTGDQAVYLARTIRAPRPLRLTVGIGGGDRLAVWLNGRNVATAETHLHRGRYGCTTHLDGTRVDQVIVDLDLQAGDNTLLIRLTPATEASFYFSTSPNPAPRLWEHVRRAYPADRHPLLARMHADWFTADGWLAAADSTLEQQFIEQSAADCGPDRAHVERRLQRLRDEQVDHNDARWLDLCVKVSVLAQLRTDLARLRAAVDALGGSYPQQYPAAESGGELDAYEERLAALAAGRFDPADDTAQRLLEELPRMRRRMLVDRNPLLRNVEILFVKRFTYNSKHYYDDFQHISRWGGNLCALSLADGAVRQLVPQLTGGVFDRYDVSFDATKVVFGYRRPRPEGFRIYEVGVDGSGLRQVTRPPADEDERIAAYGKTSTGDGFYGLMGYRFWTDDVHPCYLPDGDLCFASTRSEHGVLCTPNHYLACTNLYRMRADGGGLRPISQGALSEFTPTMLDDGRILYNRWEYVYKGIAAVQPLWITRPDGSGSEELYGDNITNPGVFWQARQVPGHPRLVVCTGCGHEPLGVGHVLLLNLDRNKRTAAPMTSLTPNVKAENLRGLYQLRNGVWREDVFGPFYADPYPLSDKFFLVSCNPHGRYNDQAAYGIYLLDAFGNRVLLYDDPEISSWQPMACRPRTAPPSLPEVRSELSEGEATATVFVNDVYRGLEGVAAGTVKYLRVMEQIPKPWAAEVDPLRDEDRAADGFGGHIAVSHNAHIWVAVLRGIAPVDDDGSACFEVPAGRNLFFQALDADFMEIQRMRTFVNFAPGERRSCIGCHEHRAQAPQSRPATALGRPPAKLAAQPGETAPRPLHYPSDVQPMFDRHCVRCHNGQDPKAAPDLRGDLTTLFNRSYENIFQAGLVDTIREWAGLDYAMQHAEATQPYAHGAHRSKLVEVLRQGHYDVELAREEWVRLVTWIDCGAPYYGSYFGRRHVRYQGQPDFRPVPTVDSACGIRPDFPVPPRPQPLPAKLLAWWPLDDAEANAAHDASGNNHHAKVVGATASSEANDRVARRFDGAGFLEASDFGAHQAVSIAMWVRADALRNRWNPLLFCHGGQPGAIHFSLLTDGTPNVAVNTSDWNWTHCKAHERLRANEWRHVAVVCDARFGGRATFYVDGRTAGEERLGLGIPLDLYKFRIGGWDRWESEPQNNFHGAIRHVRIYRGMLTEAQVAQLAGEGGN